MLFAPGKGEFRLQTGNENFGVDEHIFKSRCRIADGFSRCPAQFVDFGLELPGAARKKVVDPLPHELFPRFGSTAFVELCAPPFQKVDESGKDGKIFSKSAVDASRVFNAGDKACIFAPCELFKEPVDAVLP